MNKNTSQVNCSLCMKKIEGKIFYIDKYPHHEECSLKVWEYMRLND